LLALVYVAATIYDITNVDEVVGFTEVNLGLSVFWIDARLNYFNLVSKTEQNVLSITEPVSIWAPVVKFKNKIPNFEEMEVVTSPTVSIIANMSSSSLSSSSSFYTTNVFPGSSNSLLWQKQIRWFNPT